MQSTLHRPQAIAQGLFCACAKSQRAADAPAIPLDWHCPIALQHCLCLLREHVGHLARQQMCDAREKPIASNQMRQAFAHRYSNTLQICRRYPNCALAAKDQRLHWHSAELGPHLAEAMPPFELFITGRKVEVIIRLQLTVDDRGCRVRTCKGWLAPLVAWQNLRLRPHAWAAQLRTHVAARYTPCFGRTAALRLCRTGIAVRAWPNHLQKRRCSSSQRCIRNVSGAHPFLRSERFPLTFFVGFTVTKHSPRSALGQYPRPRPSAAITGLEATRLSE